MRTALQHGIDRTVLRENKMSLAVSRLKTTLICYSPPRHLPPSQNSVFLNGQPIRRVRSHTHSHLELVVVERVNWRSASKSTLASCQRLLYVLRWLLSTKLLHVRMPESAIVFQKRRYAHRTAQFATLVASRGQFSKTVGAHARISVSCNSCGSTLRVPQSQ